ncbi:STAS domain-containing protein [bacterium]|nr:STAS domain-containing protein [bacterium]
MKFCLEFEQDTAHLRLIGRFDLAAAKRFRGLAQWIGDSDVRSLEVELSQLQFLDSSGIGVLLLLRNGIEKKQGRMSLRKIPPAINETLYNAGLEEVFRLADP